MRAQHNRSSIPNLAPLLALIALTCGTAGCTGRADSAFNGLTPRQAGDLAHRLSVRREQLLRDDLRDAFGATGGRPTNVLVLSGGDADGAYGCGLLRAWRDDPVHPRPTFDVVTGVSTGALMATFAFLGEPQDDDTLHTVYTGIRDSDVYAGPAALPQLLSPGAPDSVFDTGPLRRLIARRVTRDVLARVAAAHRQGRRLYVSTVELDSGQVVIWPMSRIAFEALATGSRASADAGLEKFRNILLASASIPVLFPPVKIEGGLHVDAGVREALTLRRAMLGREGIEDREGREGREDVAAGSGEATVYVIVNGKLHPEPEAVGDNLVAIGGRSLDLYQDAVLLFNLRDAAHVAAGHDPPFRFRFVSVPLSVDDAPGPGLFYSMFDPAVMARLYAAGQERARRPRPWVEGPPRLDEDPAEEPEQ